MEEKKYMLYMSAQDMKMMKKALIMLDFHPQATNVEVLLAERWQLEMERVISLETKDESRTKN